MCYLVFVMKNNLLAVDRKKINNKIASNDFLSGRNRTKSVCGCISVLTKLLSDHDISLDMITGDQLLAASGSITVRVRPLAKEPFTELPEFTNTMISLSWHTDLRDGLVDLSRAEVVTYLS